MYQDLCSMAQTTAGATVAGATAGRATTGGTAGAAGAAVAGATAGGATAGVTAGRGTGVGTAWGPTFGRTAGRLSLGLSPLRSDAGPTLLPLFAVTTVGFNGRPKRPRPGLVFGPTGRGTSTSCGSASTTQARDRRARMTWKTLSKILVWITVRCCSSAEYHYMV